MSEQSALRSGYRAARLSAVALVSFVAVVLMTSLQACAQDTWTLSSSLSGDWSNGGNWSAGVPTSNSTASIVNGGTATISQLGQSCATLSLGNSAASGTVQVDSGALFASSYQYVGNSGVGSFVQSGGTNAAGNIVYLARTSASVGSYSLGGGLLSLANSGVNPNNGLFLGYAGNGTFTQTGGTANIACDMSIGVTSAGSGTYSLGGTGIVSVGDEEDVGTNGKGSFFQSGGANIYGSLFIAHDSGSRGSYTLTTGTLAAAENLGGIVVGYAGPGSFTQYGGVSTAASLAVGGYFSLTSGSYSLSGPGLLSTVTQVVGYSGTGGFTQSAGTNLVSGEFYLGYSGWIPGPRSSGMYSLSGTGLLSVSGSGEYLGYYGEGTFTQTGGTNTASTLCLASSSGASGTYNLNGGRLVTGSISQGAGSAAFNFGTGTLAAGGNFSTPISMSLTGGNATLDSNGWAVTLTGSLSGPGSLTKIGSGRLWLTGSNTYAGPTTVNQGSMVVNGSLVSAVTVNSGGTLAGTGSLGSVTIGPSGAIAPGTPLGTLSVSGSLVLAAGAALNCELDTPSNSALISCSSLTLNGQQFTDFNFTPTANFGRGTYDLIETSSPISGSLGVSTSGTIDGEPASLSFQGDNLVLTVVPEPGSLALLAVAVIGLLAYDWRRRRQSAPAGDDAPAILSSPSYSSAAIAARRAA